MRQQILRVAFRMLLPTVACIAGCTAAAASGPASVTDAWRHRDDARTPQPTVAARQRSATRPGAAALEAIASSTSLATINGRVISRERIVGLLLRSYGGQVLEQVIGLETAKQAAEGRGLVVTQKHVDAEYERALKRLSNPLASVTPNAFDRPTAERLLETVLIERNMSREVFDLIMRRNAHLRQLAVQNLVLSEDELRREFDRLHGRRIRVRHIQLATLAEITQMRERIQRGEELGALATRYSANAGSAARGGLLEPFSASDKGVPAAFLQAALALEPGQLSDAVRVGEWYHLIQLDEILPVDAAEFEQVRGAVEASLRDRKSDLAMPTLFEKLFEQATIEIHDPLLRDSFDRRRSQSGG